MAANPQFNEDRLDALRRSGANRENTGSRDRPRRQPFPKPASAMSYHGNPVLKPPPGLGKFPFIFLWRGRCMSAVIALAAHLLAMLTAARWIWIDF